MGLYGLKSVRRKEKDKEIMHKERANVCANFPAGLVGLA